MKSARSKQQASILAIGTELTSGQTLNRNASWISNQLESLGIETALHLCVADEKPKILRALDACAEAGSLIFVTGGLGPTTDDITRTCVAEWLSRPLEFQPKLWKDVEAFLTSKGVPVAESNRQQCFLPRGSRVLKNPVGTAPGFFARRAPSQQLSPSGQDQSEDIRIWVLPGPPREIQSIWQLHPIAKDLAEHSSCEEQLFLFRCIGKSEAELGEITEKTLAKSGLRTGYRAHIPYVEIKVWAPQKRSSFQNTALQSLESAIQPWLYSKGENYWEKIQSSLERLKARHVRIIDAATSGKLANRLADEMADPLLPSVEIKRTPPFSLELTTYWSRPISSDPLIKSEPLLSDFPRRTDSEFLFVLWNSLDRTQAKFLFSATGLEYETCLELPYRRASARERTELTWLELGLKQWAEWLDTAQKR